MTNSLLLKMAIEILSVPKQLVIFNSYLNVYQRGICVPHGNCHETEPIGQCVTYVRTNHILLKKAYRGW